MIKDYSQFLGTFIVFAIYLYFGLILFRGLFMIMQNFFDKKNTMFHHHFHYKDRRGK